MAAVVQFAVVADSTAEAVGNRSLAARFAKTAGALGCQPFFFSRGGFTCQSDASYVFLRKNWYTEGAPAKHHIAITGSQIAHPSEEPGRKGTIGFPYR
jgi:hypothetical protein